jgi:hypothetical protein
VGVEGEIDEDAEREHVQQHVVPRHAVVARAAPGRQEQEEGADQQRGERVRYALSSSV